MIFRKEVEIWKAFLVNHANQITWIATAGLVGGLLSLRALNNLWCLRGLSCSNWNISFGPIFPPLPRVSCDFVRPVTVSREY